METHNVRTYCLPFFKAFQIRYLLLWTNAQSRFMYVQLMLCAYINCPLMFAQDGPTKLYIKPVACSSTFPHPLQSYMDSNCSKVHLDPNSYFVGACVTQGAPPGCGSFMIMCSRASAAAISMFSLVFACIIMCI